jgi:uridine kinase
MFVGLPALEDVVVSDWESPTLYRWDDFSTALSQLKLGNMATINANSRESTETGILTREIEPRPIIVVAGFLALHDEVIRTLYDETIYIDIPEEEIVRRRKARANPDSPWDTDEYINNGLLPGHRKFVVPQRPLAGNVVDGLVTRDELAEKVLSIIDSAVSLRNSS